MHSKTKKEVMKRRGKPGPSPLSLYQKVVLLAGALAVFLTIGTSLKMAPIISVGIIGVTSLIFFLIKYNQPKIVEEKKADLKRRLFRSEEEALHQQRILHRAEEKVVDALPEAFPEEKKVFDFQGVLPEGQEKVVNLPEFPEDEKGDGLKEISPKEGETVFDLRQMFAREEKKVVGQQAILLKTEEKGFDLEKFSGEEKAFDLREMLLKSEKEFEGTI